MKKIFIAMTCILTAGSFAHATDLPESRHKRVASIKNPDQTASIPLPTIAAYDWTGFYAGIHGGYGFGSDKATLVRTASTNYATYTNSLSLSPKGALGGAQTGYNYQVGSFVGGLEIGGGYLGLSDTKTGLTDTSMQLKEKSTYYGTGTGRIGFAYDRFLAYGKGGIAAAKLDDTLTGINISASEKKLRLGYTAGAGIEYAITDELSAKLEYDYMAFGKKTTNWTNTAGTSLGSVDNKATVQAVMVGLNYHFGAQPAYSVPGQKK